MDQREARKDAQSSVHQAFQVPIFILVYRISQRNKEHDQTCNWKNRKVKRDKLLLTIEPIDNWREAWPCNQYTNSSVIEPIENIWDFHAHAINEVECGRSHQTKRSTEEEHEYRPSMYVLQRRQRMISVVDIFVYVYPVVVFWIKLYTN